MGSDHAYSAPNRDDSTTNAHDADISRTLAPEGPSASASSHPRRAASGSGAVIASDDPDDDPRERDADADETLAFRRLDPSTLLDAIDAAGHLTDGRVSALNSYENRVYAVGLESGATLVAKFYRPGRWSDEAILEEHDFCLDLVDAGLPVVAPLVDADGESLLRTGPFRFALFPRVGGRAPELDDPTELAVVGRTVGRLHEVSRAWDFEHRPFVDADRLGASAIEYLVDSETVPGGVRDAYETLAWELLDLVEDRIDEAGDVDEFPIHGDMHPGNILWGPDGVPRLLDFDDAATGPAVQDLWMFVSGDRDYAEARLGNVLDGYTTHADFDVAELALIEPLRTLRLVNFAAWIAERWVEPAFRRAFPYFEGDTFWDEHVRVLQEQRQALHEPALRY